MVVAVETVVVQALNIATGVEIPVAIPIFVKEDVEVTYGIDGLPTVLNVDFTIEQLDEQNFDTFILTPLAALLTKINDLIAADPDEINAIYIRRRLDYKTSATADAVKNTPYTSKEFDRTAARFQQLQEQVDRSVKFVKSVAGGNSLQVRPLTQGKVPVVSSDGLFLQDGPTASEVSNAQSYATAAAASATASANSATSSGTSATASAVSAAAALASQNKAQQWAENPEDVAVDPGAYSAKHWALKALSYTWNSLGTAINAFTNKTPPVGADELAIADSAAAWVAKRLSLTNLAAWLASLAQTLTNKTLDDATTLFSDNTTPTKQFKFEASGITAATTRTYTAPNADGTLSLIGQAETFSGVKTFSAIPVMSGGAIQFPATQVPSSDPNALDEYEEGTWTPALQFGGAAVGITYSAQSGTYVRIGKAIILQGRIILSNKGSSTGAATLTGSPFAGDVGAGINVCYFGGMASLVDGVYGYGASPINLVTGGATGVANLTNANFNNNSDIIFNVIGREA